MKKVFSIILGVLILFGVTFLTLFSTNAFAEESSQYDMWKGVFVRDNLPSEAGGEVMLNYVKGKNAYILNVETWGLEAGEDYEVVLMTTAGWSSNAPYHKVLGSFIADEYGYGHLHINWLKKGDISDLLDNENIRVVVYDDFSTWQGWVLSTSYVVEDGDFQPISSNRTK